MRNDGQWGNDGQWVMMDNGNGQTMENDGQWGMAGNVE